MLLLSLIAPTLSPNADFARCVKALRNSPAYAVRVEATTKVRKLSVSSLATLAFRSKQWVTLDVETPAEIGRGALNWVCEVQGRTLRAYDINRKAYILQTFSRPLLAVAGLQAKFGNMIPDAIQTFMNPDELDKFFGRFTSLHGWHRTLNGGSLTWSYKNASGTVKFTFDQGTAHLTSWRIDEASSTAWNLSYPALSSVPPLTIPEDTALVDSFRLPPPRPKVGDETAQAVVDKCFDAYEKALRVHADVSVDGAEFNIWRDGGSIEEVGPSGGWRWVRGTLTLWPKNGAVYTGETRLSRVRSYLAQLEIETEPLAISFMNDGNYAGTLFTKDYDVKKVGSVVLHGEPLALLQLTGPAVRVDLNVDDSGLIRSVDSTAFDSSGQRMAETVRRISYTVLGIAPTPPSGHLVPLPKLLPPKSPPSNRNQLRI